jgi:putative ATP-dependent endonuclease of OLD family
VTRFVLKEMGQAIVTSHSPYVIEQFEPASIVMLDRDEEGHLGGVEVDLSAVKEKTFKRERRQFAEAVLARAVLVVEGPTEAVLVPAVADALERELGADAYVHPDLAGVSIFNAGTDSQVPPLGPVFKSLGKAAFSLRDKAKEAPSREALEQLGAYDIALESPHSGAEKLLAEEVAPDALRRFLEAAKEWPDYPRVAKYRDGLPDPEVIKLAQEVLEARKGSGYGYAARLIEFCGNASELPQTVVTLLKNINDRLSPAHPEAREPQEDGAEVDGA